MRHPLVGAVFLFVNSFPLTLEWNFRGISLITPLSLRRGVGGEATPLLPFGQ